MDTKDLNIHFGVDYYPEHWKRDRWETDAKLMKEMGVQVVRLAEFSWFKMEPSEGKYDFEWLKDAVALLDSYGIKSVLGTPTAAPPAWMCEAYPEILPIDSHGDKRHFGGRHHDCQSNPVYRKYCADIVTKMAETFSGNPGVIGWQIDNELGNSHGDFCHCDSCRKHFIEWLRSKYITIDRLNEAWGTAFWSQGHASFDEIDTPKITAVGINPATMLDWKLFHSDLITDFANAQIEIIRKLCPKHFITHNYMCFDNVVNYYDLGAKLDFVSNDIYPGGNWNPEIPKPACELAASNDVIRGYKKNPFWMMEQQSSIPGWDTMSNAPRPGEAASWAMQSVAHGADAIVFFRWRSCAFGTEQYWHGVIGHNGKPGRVYNELKEMIDTFSPFMEEIKGSMPPSEVAIIHSFKENYALDIQKNHPDLNYVNQLMLYHKAFYEKNMPVDFVRELDDLSAYKLVVAPLLYIMTPEIEEHLREYVRSGGNLILTMRTGVKDDNNNCMIDEYLPGALKDVAGIEIPEYDCLYKRDAVVDFEWKEYPVSKWADLITPTTAKTLGLYGNNFYKGTAAITKNKFGDGTCYYIGTEPSYELLEALTRVIAKDCGLSTLGSSEENVEIMARTSKDTTWTFVINHSETRKDYKLKDSAAKLLVGEKEGVLNPFEVHLYKTDF